MLPLSRLLFVFLLAGSFAVAFAELVQRADRPDPPLSAFARCGEAAGIPCPARADLD